MKTRLILGFVIAAAIAPATRAAETGSFVRQIPGHTGVARGTGHGDWVRTEGRVRSDFSRALGIAADDHSLSVSHTSVFRGPFGNRGNTLHITVAPRGRGVSTGYARTDDAGSGVVIGGYSSPYRAAARNNAFSFVPGQPACGLSNSCGY